MWTSLVLCMLVASIYGWWDMARDRAVTIALLRQQLAAANDVLSIDERLQRAKVEAIHLRTELTRLQVESSVLHQTLKQRRQSGQTGGTNP